MAKIGHNCFNCKKFILLIRHPYFNYWYCSGCEEIILIAQKSDWYFFIKKDTKEDDEIKIASRNC